MSKTTLQSDEGAECTSFLDMPGYLLRRCHQIAVAIFLEECRDFDLTPLQYVTLAALDRFGSMDQVTLGGVTALDRTTILGVLRKLEERALITRTTSDKDKRAKGHSIAAQRSRARTIVEAAEKAGGRQQRPQPCTLSPAVAACSVDAGVRGDGAWTTAAVAT